MIRFILFFLSLITINICMGHDTEPDGRWRLCLEREDGTCTFGEMATHGKVEKNGVSYSLVIYEDHTLYLRQVGEKVYLQDEEQDREVLLMDYGLQVGDVFTRDDGKRMDVLAVSDTMPYCVSNEIVRMIRLRDEENGMEDVWIKGIGSLQTGILPHTMIPDGIVSSLEFYYSHQLSDVAFLGIDKRLYKSFSYEPIESDDAANEYMEYEFCGDTLHISGAIKTNCYHPFFLTVSTEKDCIKVEQLVFPELFMACQSTFLLDFKVPGYSEGEYMITFCGTFPATATCMGSVQINCLSETTDCGETLFDLQGRPLSSPPSRGMYIQNGKKVIK